MYILYKITRPLLEMSIKKVINLNCLQMEVCCGIVPSCTALYCKHDTVQVNLRLLKTIFLQKVLTAILRPLVANNTQALQF